MNTNAIVIAESRVSQLRRELERAEADLRSARNTSRRVAIFEQVQVNLKEGRPIDAIKVLRNLPDSGSMNLRDAKDIIEFIHCNFNPK